ncbi:MAG: hypothetical protein ACRCZF_17810, partial [Gemmataceae bacterium]
MLEFLLAVDPTPTASVFPDAIKLATTVASDQIKQLMTVSTATITFSLVFTKDFIVDRDRFGIWKIRLLFLSLF